MHAQYMYSQTCLSRSLMGNVKSDILKEVQEKRTKVVIKWIAKHFHVVHFVHVHVYLWM
jgi:hypothetical protein